MLRLKVLKAVMLRERLLKIEGSYSVQTKEELTEEYMKYLQAGDVTEADIDEWIASLKEDLAKTPEQREKEHEEFIEQLCEAEWEQARQEMEWMRHDRDEWDDFWDDRARDCGAIRF